MVVAAGGRQHRWLFTAALLLVAAEHVASVRLGLEDTVGEALLKPPPHHRHPVPDGDDDDDSSKAVRRLHHSHSPPPSMLQMSELIEEQQTPGAEGAMTIAQLRDMQTPEQKAQNMSDAEMQKILDQASAAASANMSAPGAGSAKSQPAANTGAADTSALLAGMNNTASEAGLSDMLSELNLGQDTNGSSGGAGAAAGNATAGAAAGTNKTKGKKKKDKKGADKGSKKKSKKGEIGPGGEEIGPGGEPIGAGGEDQAQAEDEAAGEEQGEKMQSQGKGKGGKSQKEQQQPSQEDDSDYDYGSSSGDWKGPGDPPPGQQAFGALTQTANGGGSSTAQAVSQGVNALMPALAGTPLAGMVPPGAFSNATLLAGFLQAVAQLRLQQAQQNNAGAMPGAAMPAMSAPVTLAGFPPQPMPLGASYPSLLQQTAPAPAPVAPPAPGGVGVPNAANVAAALQRIMAATGGRVGGPPTLPAGIVAPPPSAPSLLQTLAAAGSNRSPLAALLPALRQR